MNSSDPHRRRPPSPGRFSRIRNGTRLLVATPLFMARHALKARSIERITLSTAAPTELPPVAPRSDRFQGVDDGVGPNVFRQYSIEVARPAVSPAALLGVLAANPNVLTNWAMAAFMVDDEPATDLALGDQLVVELGGPWNGPVEVVTSTTSKLVLATLDGHMEAGVIRFDTEPITGVGNDTPVAAYRFRITSWARAGDRAFEFLHVSTPIGRELQTAMWVAMCRRAAALAGAPTNDVRVVTEFVDAQHADADLRSVS